MRISRPLLVVALVGSAAFVASFLGSAIARKLSSPEELFPGVTVWVVTNVRGPFSAPSLSATMVLTAAVLPLLLLGAYRSSAALERWGYGLILGGGAANFFERVRFGYVTDYLQTFGLSSWNLADAAIAAGLVSILATWFVRWRRGL